MECFGCLFGRIRPHAADSTLHGHGQESTTGSNNSDLLADEGANYQQGLWQLAVQQKLMQTQQRSIPINIEFNDISIPESFLQTLTASYNTNGFAQRVPRLRQIFTSLEPFVSALNTMASSHVVAALVWGSLTLIFHVSLKT